MSRNSPPMHRYAEIALALREGILRGEFAAEGRLPSERKLMDRFGVQRNTVRQALGVLEREGMIVTKSKSGWYIADRSLSGPPPTVGRRILIVTFRHQALPTFDTLAVGLQEVVSSAGLSVLRYDSPPVNETTSQLATSLEALATVDAAGMVLWPQTSVEVSLLRKIQTQIPVVMVDRRVFGFETDNVRFDDVSGGQQVTDHLIRQGHRRIAFVADEPFVETVQNRWRGYRLALEEHHISADDRHTVFSLGSHEPQFSASVRQLFDGDPIAPTAIVCSNDGVASRVMLVLRGMGLDVPGDVAVTGFGNEAAGYLEVMGLTTVTQSFLDLGRAAGQLLLERLAKPIAASGRFDREIVIPVELLVRSSSNAPRP